jgi:photosystem II stability/assembly factor-like uncharacterized protein
MMKADHLHIVKNLKCGLLFRSAAAILITASCGCTRRENLNSVYVSDENHAIAVGDKGVILEFDGSAWRKVPSPTQKDLNGVGGNSSHDVFAVGNSGTILRYNGTTWQQMDSPTTEDLLSVSGDGAGGAFAVGFRPTILRFSGQKWQVVDIHTLRPEVRPFVLFSVCAIGPDRALAAGTKGTLLGFNGSDWKDLAQKKRDDATGLFTAPVHSLEMVTSVWFDDGGNTFAVTAEPAILQYDGKEWQRWGIAESVAFRSIWGARLSDVGLPFASVGGPAMPLFLFVVGDRGLILYFDGRGWRRMESGTKDDLHSVSGTHRRNLFAVGAEGAILHYDGRVWTRMR